MKEIIISKDEMGQRLDRYIRKYLGNASLSFIYKQIRKKNIVVNDKKTTEKYILEENDNIKIYFSDETIEKLKKEEKKIKSKVKLDIVYEDDNILVMNKPAGLLSHSTKDDYREENLVSAMTAYLINKGDYKVTRNSTFTPSIANRLDRNTSGLVIGAKNYMAIKELNKAQRKDGFKKFYKTVVLGKVKGEKVEKASYEKLENKTNQVKISKENSDNKEVVTGYKSLLSGEKYSLLEIDLITGRTHQIRAHLSYLKMPIIGDRKYGNSRINKYFKDKYKLENQLLHCYRLIFLNLKGDLYYLNGTEIVIDDSDILKNIIIGEIDENYRNK